MVTKDQKKKPPDLLLIAGSFDGINGVLSTFSNIVPKATVGEIFRFLILCCSPNVSSITISVQDSLRISSIHLARPRYFNCQFTLLLFSEHLIAGRSQKVYNEDISSTSSLGFFLLHVSSTLDDRSPTIYYVSSSYHDLTYNY